ncbi:MAG: hypothetical protein HC918_03395 [Oscillatoriales cyanobacterium SM2_1_8]|nr:hypothetical protein [Oscillatoriales cyanobacterium SM2_1_8]
MGNRLERAIAPAVKPLPVAASGLPVGTVANLPPDWLPPEPAELQEVRQWRQGGVALWRTPKPTASVAKFYRDRGFQGENILSRRQDKGLAIVHLQAQSDTQTQVVLQYALGINLVESPAAPPKPSEDKGSTAELLPAWRQYLMDLQALGVLGDEDPNRPVRRREFARWLWQTNNLLFEDVPARQVRPGRANAPPLFRDVPNGDPDFGPIQGLAASGLIPSTPMFEPEALLTRQDLLIWKVPLDTRRPLPGATAQAVQEALGFQDVASLSPRGLQAALADAAAGDVSNLRRSLGLTLRLQPQQPVTVAEATATLWYIGDPKDGRSAQSVLAARKLMAAPNQELQKGIDKQGFFT